MNYVYNNLKSGETSGVVVGSGYLYACIADEIADPYKITDDNITTLTPTEGWHYATGYWATTKGDVFNLPEKIAEQSGSLAPENPKERKMVMLALNYAKQRRERSILALQQEIANLDKVISALKN